MARQQYVLDYIIKSSPAILYNFLATPSGLAQWFADEVDQHNDILTFVWEGYGEQAKILGQEDDEFIRFEMESGEAGEYLEFRIDKSEVTDDTILIVTDFSDEGEYDDIKRLWDSQIDTLLSRLGARN
ncbi:MAG: ATPase [Sphingobacteriales bacterium]|nr:ATPase [Sphingobacteriales bacterium]MCC7224328.1 ATPase [Chitinophagales bacterium]